MNKSYRRLIVTTTLLCVVYTATWYYFSKKFEGHVEQQLAHVQAKGFDVSFEKLTIGGFPFGYDITVNNLEVRRSTIFKTWIDGAITFSAKLWKPQEISSLAAGTHHLEFDNFKIQGEGFALKSFTFDPMRFQFSYDNLDVTMADLPVFSSKEIAYDIDFTPENAEKNYAEFVLRAEDVSSPLLEESPLGSVIQHIHLKTNLQGIFEGKSSFQRLSSWFNSDGILDVKEVNLKWGDLGINGEGTLSVDEKLQPIAAFTVTVEGLNETVDSFVQKGLLRKNIGEILKTGVNFFSFGGDSKLSFSIQERKVIIGSVPIAELPKINWSENEG